MRYELTDHEWTAIKPFLPNNPRGVPRVNDRRVLNGIFWVLRSGAPWRDLPGNFGPYTTCYNRFVRWRRAGVWGRIMNALAMTRDAYVQIIDTSIVRVHQHGACITRNRRQSMGRSRGGLTSKIHAVVDINGLPVRLGLTAGEAHDNRLLDQHAIAHVLRDEPAKALHGCGDNLLISSNHLPQVFRVYARGQCRRTDEVGKHHRDLEAFSGVAGHHGRACFSRGGMTCLKSFAATAQLGDRAQYSAAMAKRFNSDFF
jgi:transposase